ncbi:MAG: GIY-YIG nuclease family protein [Rikenellaceae bacterium]|nr:GIY-YIG nuclease family protein [Rikenellaceae bacterium]
MKEAGYVYILTNPSFKEDWVKIGKSSRPVDIRSKELDNTAVPLPFEIYATLKTVKYSEVEKLIHHYIERFTNLRIRNNREFFNVAPEEALAIFKEVALLLDDAEIDEVFKKIVLGETDKICTSKPVVLRKESLSWLLPANRKFFDLDACLSKYNEVYWTQNYKIQKGDMVYIYASSPDSCIKYKFLVEAHNVQCDEGFEREKEFYIDIKDFEEAKKRNCFVKLRLLAQSHAQKMSLPHLLENGLSMAPRGGINLSNNASLALLKYIESNF